MKKEKTEDGGHKKVGARDEMEQVYGIRRKCSLMNRECLKI